MKKACVFAALLLLASAVSVCAQEKKTAMESGRFTFGINADPAGFLTQGPAVAFEFTKGGFNAQINLRSPFLGLTAGNMTRRRVHSAEFMSLDHFGDLYVGTGNSNGHDTTDTFLVEEYAGIGLGFSYFLHNRLGGFYAGGFLEFSYGRGDVEVYRTIEPGWYDSNGEWHHRPDDANWTYSEGGKLYQTVSADEFSLSFAVNTGFKFVLSPGIYFRTGAYLGATRHLGANDWYFYWRPDITVGYNF